MPVVIYLPSLAINLCAGVDIGSISLTNTDLRRFPDTSVGSIWAT
jgi:hypothetical protein